MTISRGPITTDQIKLVIIGHIAFNKNITPYGENTSIGGSAYYSAIGASIFLPFQCGVVASIGGDFDTLDFANLRVDKAGIKQNPAKKTTVFTITQNKDGSRTFRAEWGSGRLSVKDYPQKYLFSRYVHLPTAPPDEQLKWIRWLRNRAEVAFITIDTFEHYALLYPLETRQAIGLADGVFMNKEEANLLNIDPKNLTNKFCVYKCGSEGARFYSRDICLEIPAPKVKVVDTTGAGDLLAGSFLSQYCVGTSVEVALNRSVITASQSVTQFGVEHILNNPTKWDQLDCVPV